MKKEKVIPRKRLENESEKDYKIYLREFYFNLNPPKPSTRYDFAYENNLVDSAEVMDGKDGLYVKYLEEFYNDYYIALEQKVNFAFHMPNSLLDSKYDNKIIDKNSRKNSFVDHFKKGRKTKKISEPELETEINDDYITDDETKKDSIVTRFKNKFKKEKERTNKKTNIITKGINKLKTKSKKNIEETKIGLLDRITKILPKAIILISSISVFTSLLSTIGSGKIIAGIARIIVSVATLIAGIYLDNKASSISENVKPKKERKKIFNFTKKEEKEKKKQKGKILSLF